jgi:hypothetical protein
MLGCQTAHIALLVVDELGWKSPFPTADVEARPAPLPVMTSGGGGTTTDAPTVGALATIIVSCCPAAYWRMPPLVGHPYRPGESLLYVDACLGILLYRDANFYLLIGIGPHLLHMRWLLSCKGSSLLGRGSWIAERVPWSHGRKDWRPLCTHVGRCMWNTMLVMPMLMPSSRTSSPRHAHLVSGPNSLPT